MSPGVWWRSRVARPGNRRERRRRLRRAGFTLLEVLAALGLVGAVGVVATGSGHALARLAWVARGEVSGRLAAERKMEELLSLRRSELHGGHDEEVLAGMRVRRIWRILPDAPARGLTRVEVSASWDEPRLTVLTFVAVAS